MVLSQQSRIVDADPITTKVGQLESPGNIQVSQFGSTQACARHGQELFQ